MRLTDATVRLLPGTSIVETVYPLAARAVRREELASSAEASVSPGWPA